MFHSSASKQKRCTLEQGPIANSVGEEERNRADVDAVAIDVEVVLATIIRTILLAPAFGLWHCLSDITSNNAEGHLVPRSGHDPAELWAQYLRCSATAVSPSSQGEEGADA